MNELAEMNVIGSLLIDGKCIEQICSIISADMFTSPLLGRIYLEYQRGYDNRYDVNEVVLLQRISGDEFPKDIVMNEIKNCVSVCVTSAGVKSYALAIRNDHKARQLNTIISSVRILPGDISGQIGKLINDLESLQENKSSKTKDLAQIVQENKDKYFTENVQERLNIGFPKLDDILGGLEGGDMIVIGARPAVGKSAFVTQMTSHFASQGKRVGFYNLEMLEKQMYERFVVNQSGISLTRLRRAKRFLGDEKERFDKANDALSRKSNIVISTGSRSVSEIRAESRHMNYDVIVIDYLQLLRPDVGYKGNRTAEVGAISRAVKGIAMEFNIPVIVLSQLNRVSELKDTREPTMAELREAGDIEQDASVIILMWNLSQDDSTMKGCKTEKNRQGMTGKVVLKFNGDLMQFEETEMSMKEVNEWAKSADDDCPFR